MATISKRLSALVNDAGKSEILLRFVYGKSDMIRAHSGLFVAPSRWSDKDGKIIIPRLDTPERLDLVRTVTKLDNLCNEIIEAFSTSKREDVSKKWLVDVINGFHHPEKKKHHDAGLIAAFSEFLTSRDLSDIRVRNYEVVRRILQRYELYSGKMLLYNNVDDVLIRDIDSFIKHEHEIFADYKYSRIYDALPERRPITKRGQNTVNDMHKKIRAFIIWSISAGYISNNPYNKFPIGECVYGTPYYITIDERAKITTTNLQRHPNIAIQRDIFVFQCLIGCRVGDLLKMTKSNVINGAIEYIPRKTKEGRPVLVRVPLNATARSIVERYANCAGEQLLPFISEQKYNDTIKRIFKAAGITRSVTVINPTTREEEKRRICDIASSHLARRTFVGNLYKQVKDPNLVGALSGHKEGSKAFARYRNIDEEMRTELVDLLEMK